MFVADTSNSRVLRYPKEGDDFSIIPNLVLGKDSFSKNTYTNKQTSAYDAVLNSPLDVFCDGENLFVADSSYNRVLIWKNAVSLTQSDNGKAGK